MGNRINIGQTVRDAITGFEGIVTGVAEYITGCRQVLVSKRDADRKTEWFDEDRLELIDATPFELPAAAVGVGGPRHDAPPRSA